MNPSVCRMVLFTGNQRSDPTPSPAIITRVNPDGSCNLYVFDDGCRDAPHGPTRAVFDRATAEALGHPRWWDWPPRSAPESAHPAAYLGKVALAWNTPAPAPLGADAPEMVDVTPLGGPPKFVPADTEVDVRLITTHQVDRHNRDIQLEAVGKPGPSGANSQYLFSTPGRSGGFARFGTPVVFDDDESPGSGFATDEVILAILIDRAEAIQRGPLACSENEKILDCLNTAMHWHSLWGQRCDDAVAENPAVTDVAAPRPAPAPSS